MTELITGIRTREGLTTPDIWFRIPDGSVPVEQSARICDPSGYGGVCKGVLRLYGLRADPRITFEIVYLRFEDRLLIYVLLIYVMF